MPEEEPSPSPSATPEPEPTSEPTPEPVPEPTPEPIPEPLPVDTSVVDALAGIQHSVDLLLVVALTFAVLAVFCLAILVVKAVR